MGQASAAASWSPRAVAWESLLARAVMGEGVTAVYQPIVDLQRLEVVGYESLARFVGAPGVTPDKWFAAAAARRLGAELEASVLRVALARRPALPPNCFLSVNVEPESLLSPAVIDVFDTCGGLRGLVIEVTEHRPVADWDATRKTLDRLRRHGALIAVDDAGAGHAGLQHILALRPSILKLDRALVDGVDRDEARAALVEMVGLFANKVDAWLLAEGVETQAEAQRLIDLGVPLAQGYFFGRPAPPWAELTDALRAGLTAHREAAREDTLHALIDAAPWVNVDQIAAVSARLERDPDAVIAVLDDRQRPLGVVDRRALRAGLVTPLVVSVHATPREVAHRLATRRPVDTATPVVAIDRAGRYLGVVTIPRLLAALASRADNGSPPTAWSS